MTDQSELPVTGEDAVIRITVESETERHTYTFTVRSESEVFLIECRNRSGIHVTDICEYLHTTAARAVEGLDEMLADDAAAIRSADHG